MAKLIIFGCGRGADVAARYFAKDSAHEVCGFTVDLPYVSSDRFRGLPLVDFQLVDKTFPPTDFQMFVPLGFQGMNDLRAQKYAESKAKGYALASYISSKIATHDELKTGENCFILENNTINFDVRIGNNVVMWSACQVGDQTTIHDHVWMSSHAVLSGQVTIEPYAFLGVNCTVSNRVKVARKSYIGAGTLITQDTVENGVYLGERTKRVKMDGQQALAFLDSMQKS